MQQKSKKLFIIPLISLSIFIILIFGAAYAYFVSNTTMNSSNYQITMPEITTLVCSKSDCSINITPAMMSNSNTSDTAKTSSNCSLNCTCSGTPGAICDYNVRLIEIGAAYNPSAGLNDNKEFTAKVTSPSNCTEQNKSTTETQVNTIRDKVVSNCTLTVPQSGNVSANVIVEFKWYNLDINQDVHASRRYIYQLTNDNYGYTVTFDPNGGTVETTSKRVIYGDTYGELPTPTWEGHTFKGWNGINKFNPEAYYEAGKNCNITIDNDIIFQATYGYQERCAMAQVDSIPSTRYTLSFDWEVTVKYAGPYMYSGLNFKYSDGSRNGPNLRVYYQGAKGHISEISTANKTLEYIVSAGWGYSGTFKFYNIMLNEGTTELLYEPYYITSSTKVKRASDHTLTAIWD